MNRNMRNPVKFLLTLTCVAACALLATSCDTRLGREFSRKPHVTCGLQQVMVSDSGPSPDPVYGCPGDSVQWTNGTSTSSFTVCFQASPWPGSTCVPPSSGNPPTSTSQPFPCTGTNCDYKYTLTIDNKTFDPHVIIVREISTRPEGSSSK